MRGDFKARMDAYAVAIDKEIMNPNEARDLEEMNPYEGGDIYKTRTSTRADKKGKKLAVTQEEDDET